MKRALLSVLLAISTLATSSQTKVIGIYKSPIDYLNHRLTVIEKDKHVKLHDIFFKHYIEIVGNDTTVILQKDSLYGFVTENHVTYRFQKKEIFPVLHSGVLMLYKIQPMVTKAGTPDAIYYFSRAADSPVLKLTISNMVKEYSDNLKFIELLNARFDDDYDLHLYDENNAQYIIEQILISSTK